jgi:hypothetical protein
VEAAASVEMRSALVHLRRTTGLPVAFGGLMEPVRQVVAVPVVVRRRVRGVLYGAPRALAPRELEVLACVAAGATNAVAAEVPPCP